MNKHFFNKFFREHLPEKISSNKEFILYFFTLNYRDYFVEIVRNFCH